MDSHDLPPPLVTLSGADESVAIPVLLGAWAGRSDVELAFQVSRSRAGTPRYPGMAWLENLRDALVADRFSVRVALHVNGPACSDMIGGGGLPPDVASLLMCVGGVLPFRRVQANLRASDAGPERAEDVLRLCRMFGGMGVRLVLQSKPSTLVLLARLDAMGADYDVLHDSSEGRGERSGLPAARVGRFNAWAGGLAPETIASDMHAIRARAAGNPGHGWGVDAESGLRDQSDPSRFSMDRARAFVDAARRG